MEPEVTSPAMKVLDNDQLAVHLAGGEDEGKFTLYIQAKGIFPTSG